MKIKNIFKKVGDIAGDVVVGTAQGLTGYEPPTEEELAIKKARLEIDNKRYRYKNYLFTAMCIVLTGILLDRIILTEASNKGFIQFMEDNGVILFIPMLVYFILSLLLPYIIKYRE